MLPRNLHTKAGDKRPVWRHVKGGKEIDAPEGVVERRRGRSVRRVRDLGDEHRGRGGCEREPKSDQESRWREGTVSFSVRSPTRKTEGAGATTGRSRIVG